MYLLYFLLFLEQNVCARTYVWSRGQTQKWRGNLISELIVISFNNMMDGVIPNEAPCPDLSLQRKIMTAILANKRYSG